MKLDADSQVMGGGVSDVLPLIAGYKTFDVYSRDKNIDEESLKFQDLVSLRGGQPGYSVNIPGAINGTSLTSFRIMEQRKQVGNYRLNVVNPDKITVNQRRNETNGSIISGATGWVEIKIDECQGKAISPSFSEDPIYFMYKSYESQMSILIHYFNDNTYLGCTQVSRSSTGSNLYLIGVIPENTTIIYIDIANDEVGDDWNDMSPSLTKEDVVANLMIVLPSLTYPFILDDHESLQEALEGQENAPYIYGINFEPYSDYFSPSLNHPCDIPVTKCPEGYVPVLGIGSNSVENLQKFNFPSDLELYYGEELNLNGGYAMKYSKKFTIDSSITFSDVTLGNISPRSYVRINVENPFGFAETENIKLNYLSSSIISNRFNYISERSFSYLYNSLGLLIPGDTVFLGWKKPSEEDPYDKIWDGYLYISSDTIKTAEQAKAFFATNTADIIYMNFGYEEGQYIEIEQPKDLNLTFKSSNNSIAENTHIYCYFTPSLENEEIDPDKNTEEYRKEMWFEFNADYIKTYIYNTVNSNVNSIMQLKDLTYASYHAVISNTVPFDTYFFIPFMYPFVTYLINDIEGYVNIGVFGRVISAEDYCHWIHPGNAVPLEYEIIFVSTTSLKGINFPPYVKVIWKDGVTPSFEAGKDYKIKITYLHEQDSKYGYLRPCLCSWEEY